MKAHFELLGSSDIGPRSSIGTAAPVSMADKPFHLTITPEAIDWPVTATLPLVASLVDRLPPRAAVRYEWRLLGGSGELDATTANANPDRQTTQVLYKAPAGETIATVACVAVVALGVHGVFRTEPATATIAVKHDLRRITFRAGGGVFACTDPPAGGLDAYTAFLVPRLPGALRYAAVFSDFSYSACNRAVSWTRPVADGGGCAFPITGFPHGSRDETLLWAVWIGFGGPLAGPGRLTVTITLGP